MAAPLTMNDKETDINFFTVGEIRKPTDTDYQHFLSLADNHDSWILKCDKPEVKVWTKDIPGVTVKMLKIVAEFENVEPVIMYEALEDPLYRLQWDEAVLSDVTVCRIQGCDSDICYYAMKCPLPLRNRDFIAQRCWRISPDEEYIVFNHSVAHEDYPPSPQFIRGLSYVTGYVIKKATKGCVFTYVTHSDPRGQVPKWLLNIVASRIAPRVTLKLGRAAELYSQWQQDKLESPNTTLSSTQEIPLVTLETLQLQQDDDVPLTPVKGEPDYLSDEASLEDTDSVPNGLRVDPILISDEDTELSITSTTCT